MSTKPWTMAYAPKSCADVIGQDVAAERIRQYVAGHRPGRKPLLLVGKTGVGKTSLVHALAYEMDLEVFELNASDVRNKAAIEEMVGAASKQASLFFRKKLLLIDEVDGLSGTQDRGGVTALVAMLEKSSHPIVCTANDGEADKLKPLRKACETIELSAPSHEAIIALLRRIANAEKVTIDDAELSGIANRSGGDVRAAITDLQTVATGNLVTKEDVQRLSDREAQAAIEQALMRVFKTTSAEVARGSFDNVDADVDDIIMWMDENLPKEYRTPEDLARGFQALSDADRFFGRIRRWQYYRFYVYLYDLLTAGIAAAKDAKHPGGGKYSRPSRPLLIWMANARNAKRKSLAAALAPHLHMSARDAFRELPAMRDTYRKSDKAWQRAFCDRYRLDDDAVEWLES